MYHLLRELGAIWGDLSEEEDMGLERWFCWVQMYCKRK